MNKGQLKAAFAKGARIQAWHLLPGATNSNQGQWDTLWPTDEPEFGCEAHLYRVHPEDISLIAELGQEVGAVADERLCDFFADVGEVEQFMDDLCNVVTELTGDEGEDDPITVLRRYIATSPAHTSEARDAEIEAVKSALDRAYWLGQEYWRLADSQSYSDNRRSDETRSRYNQLVIDTLAAMRQEGGGNG